MNTQNSYIYLSSRGNLKEFPTNKNNAFTNIISPSIPTQGSFEVSLANIIFPRDIILINQGDPLYKIDVVANYFNKSHPPDSTFVHGYKVSYKPQVDMISDNIYDLIKEFNNDLVDFLKRNKVLDDRQKFIFKYRRGDPVVAYHGLDIRAEIGLESEYSITLSEKLLKMLGYVNGLLVEKPSLPHQVQSINVYSDIIHPSNLGSQSIHILDILPAPSMFSKTTVLNSYKRLCVSNITRVSLKLTDQDGNPIPFLNSADVTAILHLREVF